MGNLEMNSELHLPAENRFIGGLIILLFVPQHSRKTPSWGVKLMQDYKIQFKRSAICTEIRELLSGRFALLLSNRSYSN